jgi:hypothetical protein
MTRRSQRSPEPTTGICHRCPCDILNKTSRQVKACCGHLVFVCDDCVEELSTVKHEKCFKCLGRKTPDELMREDDAIVDDYNSRYDDCFIDLDSYYYDETDSLSYDNLDDTF